MDICIDDVIRELTKNHKITNKSNVKKAYDYAALNHKNQKRKSGEPYIMHPLRVANLVASWGFESDVICAALLHDIIEDCAITLEHISNEFDSNIAKMVDTVTSIDKEIKDRTSLTKEEIDELSDRRLKEKMSEKALFIKVADRIDNLRTIDCFPEEKKIKKAQHTRSVIIPMLLHEEAFQLVDILENLCLKLEHPERCQLIDNMHENLLRINSYTTTKTLKLFSEVFSPDSSIVTNEFSSLRSSISDFKYNPRSPISIYRQINAQADNLNRDFSKLLCKKNIALYDLTLIISDESARAKQNLSEELRPSDIFLELYKNFLADKGFYLLDRGITTYKDSYYYILCDEMDNRYRLFVKTETEYMRYKLGHVIDIEDIKFDGSDDLNETKIKLFKKDHSSIYIESGATMLDFAFAIHSEIGLHFDYALIDDSKTQHKAFERLNEGDTITIVANPNIKPTLHWFKYVKTSKAVEHLIKYFLSN